MLKEYYINIDTYLTQSFGANFIFFTILLTTVVSIVYFIAISYIITQLDTRYFIRKNRVLKNISPKNLAKSNVNPPPILMLIYSILSFIINITKISFGVFLFICGLAMLVLPGQGLITMLIGLSLIPFPGKHKLEKNILARKSVRFSLNWIRIKAKKPPFIFD
ncbi:hypothetical protein [Colwellia sp. PAMC 21821]|uniref:hypothetical protein n=1 Tax=Colwellia sp. PAMC 21821 TaxID=1816219 RepID=UPI0009BE342B|nr:hypothetical protein [Colwellia sp. PAMC 21821]ARD46073.1 hypothetical protein A3Q33_18330 [Colwellia sp. PAMC 21821]